ncbi:hypothetical protein ORI89_17465 [Sphingobacterium sp. UT-1RO-CII-1]|uniref:hypothetical protein n=1 Tax=Sphingobacterium sp. UT-1RO-CII-1 TaxID=2995225 RepID=UPI00227AA0B0|nr:hypothetical protein [Sphingobacterium sp. UT-1RO-CII-1]MCY4781452.1 hypothetical protein [Sphingobacterium sp. UT-1RO-CII-1]
MKYSLITNRGDIGNILITCLNIIPILLNIHPTASFGFAAARTFDKKSKKVEPLRKNQRFKVYAYIAQRKIGDRTFQHFEYPEVSGYLLINRSANHNVESTEIMIKSMLSETYNDLPMP